MTKIGTITSLLDSKFKKKYAEEWDKVGLIFGDWERKVENVVVGLDLTTELFDYATKQKAELIIVHHPFLFEPTIEEEVSKWPYKRNLIKRIKGINMGVYVSHTNYDASKHGMIPFIMNKLSITEYDKVDDSKYGATFFWHYSIDELFKELDKKLGAKWNIRTFENDSEIETNKIALFPGSCGPEDIIAAEKSGCGLVISADFKWSTFVLAKELNVKLIQVSHSIENVFVEHVSHILDEKFKDGEVKIFEMKQKDFVKGVYHGK